MGYSPRVHKESDTTERLHFLIRNQKKKKKKKHQTKPNRETVYNIIYTLKNVSIIKETKTEKLIKRIKRHNNEMQYTILDRIYERRRNT